MNAQTVSFVRLVDVFEDCTDLMHEFIGEELLAAHPYGEATHYLITQEELMELLDSFLDDHPQWKQEAEKVQERIDQLHPHVLIDLSVKS